MISTALWLTGLVAGQLAFGHPRSLAPHRRRPDRGDADLDDLAIVIPARDEEKVLGLLLEDLGPSAAAGARVIVVDDDSSDRTAAVARRFPRTQLLAADALAARRPGKSAACALGARVAVAQGARRLVFLDADVRVAATAVEMLAAELDDHGGLVSVSPRHDPGSAPESFSALFNVVSMMGVGCGVAHPWGAFGPAMITSVSDYQRVGGHDGVRNEVTEDLALAAAYRRAGLPLTIRLGREVVRYRMYPDGFRALVEGWTKNLATGANRTPWPRLLAVVAWVATLASLSLDLVADLVATTWPDWPTVVVVALAAAQLAVMCRVAGRFGWWVPVTFPVQVVVFVAVFLHSIWRTMVSGSVTWKGRTLDARAGP